MLKHALSLLALGLLIVVPSRAQSAPPAPGVEVSLVGLGALPSSVKVADGNRVLELGVPAGGKGAPFRYRGASPLVFFREVTDAEGAVRRVPVASADFTASWGRTMVVLVATGKDAHGPTFAARAFDDSAEGFPAGHARVFNFYPDTLALNNGGRTAQVPARESRMVALDVAGSRVWMKLALQRADSWEALPPLITQVAPGMRLLVFAYAERGDAGRVENTCRTIAELVATESLALR